MIMVYEGIRGSGADCKTISSGCVMGMRDNKYFVGFSSSLPYPKTVLPIVYVFDEQIVNDRQ